MATLLSLNSVCIAIDVPLVYIHSRPQSRNRASRWMTQGEKSTCELQPPSSMEIAALA
jgi:hypothetical protein